MRIVNCIKSVAPYSAGRFYVMPEDIEESYRQQAASSWGMSSQFDTQYKPVPAGQDLNDKKILVLRQGGIGDMLFLEPVLRWLKNRYPKMTLTFATGHPDPLLNNPNIDHLISMPFDASLLNANDYHMYFQGIIEANPEIAKKFHAVDLFFRAFGIDPLWISKEEKCPRIFPSEEELKWTQEELKKRRWADETYTIGIQIDTSSANRNFPKAKMKTVLDVLAREDVRIVLIGTRDHGVIAEYYKENRENIKTALDYTVRQQILLALRYDLIIGADSFMIQVAGAHRKPVVGLYGAFSSATRMAYFHHAIGIDADAVCTPCCIHGGMACIKGYPSPCFTLIEPDTILLAANHLRRTISKTSFKFVEKS